MFMVLSSWQSHCESSPGSFDECRTAPSGRQPKTKPDDLGCESACTGCQNLHPPSPFIIITQLESWYSFYRPTIYGTWRVLEEGYVVVLVWLSVCENKQFKGCGKVNTVSQNSRLRTAVRWHHPPQTAVLSHIDTAAVDLIKLEIHKTHHPETSDLQHDQFYILRWEL